MPLNCAKANIQVQKLVQQSAAVSHVAILLASYKKELCRTWYGKETVYLEETIDDLIQRCRSLKTDLDSTKSDMVRAIGDILAEESAAAEAEQNGAREAG